MEILSDTVFKGNVDIGSTGDSNLLRITNPEGTVVSIGGDSCNLLNVNGTGWANFNSVSASNLWLRGTGLCFDDHHKISVSTDSIGFRSGNGIYQLPNITCSYGTTKTIATTDQIAALTIPKQYILWIDANPSYGSDPIPADCTQFFLNGSIPKIDKAPISFQIFKVDWPDSNGCRFTPIFADISLVPLDNGQNYMCVLVNKASGYEMRDNYQVSILI